MKITFWAILTLFLVAAISVMALFLTLKGDMEEHEISSDQFDDKGEADTENRMVQIEDAMDFKIGVVQRIAIISTSVILLVFAIGGTAALVIRIRLRSKTYRAAYVDEITGLPTKAKHRQDLDERLKDMQRNYVYISMEVDNFKYINDMYGYAYANYLLKYVAVEVGKKLLADELFSHTSEARFGLLLQYVDDTQLKKRLFGMLQEIGCIPGNEQVDTVYNLFFTCGAYRIQKNDVSAARVRQCANIAREEARHLFDNNIEFYDEHLQQRHAEQVQFEFEMRQALENNQFVLYLQPKFTTAGEKMVGAEALVRWQHPTKGLIYPDSFVPLFESNGFIVKVDYFILEEVCKCIRRWIDEKVEPVVVSVNLSRIHLYNSDLVSHLVEIADRYQVPHNLIEFELTETVIFDELNQLISVMQKLKEAGFVLSMDDFGSGYSSLNMLKRLPVDILKLDKGFIDNFDVEDNGKKDRTIISHIISMAKALDMDVLAEGVESESQKNFLISANCDMIQGYYYARPMNLEHFDREFRKLRSEGALRASCS